MNFNKKAILIAAIIIIAITAGTSFFLYEKEQDKKTETTQVTKKPDKKRVEKTQENTPKRLTQHIKTPKNVRGIYISSWVGSQIPWRTRLIKSAKEAGINSVVIDVKDSTGYIIFDTKNELFKTLGTEEIRINDIREWIQELHDQDIYVIGRITVFQDPLYTKIKPESAINTKAGAIWRDRKGLAFIDPTYKEYWDYIITLSKVCEEVGFDELNFDYIRYPTDGNLKDMVFKGSELETVPSGNSTIKSRRLKRFFAYLRQQTRPLGIPISADIFGMTLTNKDDLGIGQQLEMIVPYFDYICPMIYPSHWPKGFLNIPNPAAHPYPVINHSVKLGLNRMPDKKMRPWIQAFDLGAVYTPERMADQKKGLYDLNVYSWLLWDPANRYKNMEVEPQETNQKN